MKKKNNEKLIKAEVMFLWVALQNCTTTTKEKKSKKDKFLNDPN